MEGKYMDAGLIAFIAGMIGLLVGVLSMNAVARSEREQERSLVSAIIATHNGWMIYGSPDFLTCPLCASYAMLYAFSIRLISVDG